MGTHIGLVPFCNTYVYDTSSTSVLSTVRHTTPVLDTAYSGDGSVLAGATLGGEVSIADVGSVVAQPSVVLGSPSSGEALSSIEYVGSANAFVVGGWEGVCACGVWAPGCGGVCWTPRVCVRCAEHGRARAEARVFAQAPDAERCDVAPMERRLRCRRSKGGSR